MKLIIILIFTIFSLNSFAENWTPVSKLGTGQAFQLKSECERVTSSECFDLGDYPHEVYSITQVDRDDFTKPVYTKLQSSSCLNLEDCQLKLKALVCADKDSPIMGALLNEVYCAHHAGYQKKSVDIITLNSNKLATYTASQAAVKLEQDNEKALQEKLKRMNSGNRVLAHIMLLNDKKTLTTSQIGVMLLTYQDVKAALETGSLLTAQALISSKTPDGVIMTEQDKASILAMLNKELLK